MASEYTWPKVVDRMLEGMVDLELKSYIKVPVLVGTIHIGNPFEGSSWFFIDKPIRRLREVSTVEVY